MKKALKIVISLIALFSILIFSYMCYVTYYYNVRQQESIPSVIMEERYTIEEVTERLEYVYSQKFDANFHVGAVSCGVGCRFEIFREDLPNYPITGYADESLFSDAFLDESTDLYKRYMNYMDMIEYTNQYMPIVENLFSDYKMDFIITLPYNYKAKVNGNLDFNPYDMIKFKIVIESLAVDIEYLNDIIDKLVTQIHFDNSYQIDILLIDDISRIKNKYYIIALDDTSFDASSLGPIANEMIGYLIDAYYFEVNK